ncbi:MAG: hypothetical protein P1U58_09880 [Verrucomicrobiales bacterium]|nr:hypothetical protein [Verrucomicrobiales bacterium]
MIMKTSHILPLLILTCLSALSAEELLPTDSANLLAKLQNFEEEELAKAREKIGEKTLAVVEVLRSHLDRETRNGNLDAAVALKEQIEAMAKTTVSAELKNTPTPSNSTDSGTKETEKFYIGPVWRNSDNGVLTFQFSENGSGIKKYKDMPQPFTWVLTDEKITVSIPSNGAEKYFSAYLPQNEFWEVTAAGEKMTKYDAEE